MDKEQDEIQFLGFFGILKESCTIVSSWRKIFTQITIFLILPLSFIYLAHIQISKIIFTQILHNEFMLLNFSKGSKSYNKIDNTLTTEWMTFFLFKIGYLLFFVILSLLSTSAVVYTIACIYTAKETTLNKVLSVVPKVWKRLMITFTWNFVFVFVYNFLCILIWFLIMFSAGVEHMSYIGGMAFLLVLSIPYFMGLLYITVIWHLASVVSVLEESYGLNAMRKSRGLIKGKMGISAAVFVVLSLSFFGIQHMFKISVVFGHEGIGKRIVYGIICLVLLSISMLFQLIMETIVYFVCKSYHHENIDKSSLADHLGGYLGEYTPLQHKDIQFEEF